MAKAKKETTAEETNQTAEQEPAEESKGIKFDSEAFKRNAKAAGNFVYQNGVKPIGIGLGVGIMMALGAGGLVIGNAAGEKAVARWNKKKK